MNRYLTDTHALFWYLTGSLRLGRRPIAARERISVVSSQQRNEMGGDGSEFAPTSARGRRYWEPCSRLN